MKTIQNYQDIIAIEKAGLPEFKNCAYEYIVENSNKFSDRIAFHYFSDGETFNKPLSWTYTQFLEELNRVANLFRGLGVHRKDAVSYLLPNVPAAVFTMMGGQVAGIVNPINHMLEAHHTKEIIDAVGSKILIVLSKETNPNLWNKTLDIINESKSLEVVITVNANDFASNINPVKREPYEINGVKILDWTTSLNEQSKELSFQLDIEPEDIAGYYHTGGTTGRPKVAQHSHLNQIFNAYMINVMIGGTEGHKSLFCGLPWFHVNGIVATGVNVFINAHTLVLGTAAGYKGNMLIPNFWKMIEHYQISFFSCVPTILQFLLTVPTEDANLDCLEYALCGAAPLSTQLFNDFESHSGVKLLEAYGFTEGTCAASVNPYDGERRIGSIGMRLPFHYMKVVILDDNENYLRDAKQGEIGIVVARGAHIIKGYKEEIHNKNIWVDDGIHKWYNTGDMGKVDEQGYFWLTGRKKELIIRGGHNIDPKSIEEPLARHPAIAAVAAVGRPDKRVGELPVAYVQLKSGKEATEQELIDYGKQNIKERAAQPKRIFIIDELPVTSVGKVFKPKLSDRQKMDISKIELEALGIFKTIALEAKLTKDKGRVVFIKVTSKDEKDYSNLIQKTLGGYTFPFEIIK